MRHPPMRLRLVRVVHPFQLRREQPTGTRGMRGRGLRNPTTHLPQNHQHRPAGPSRGMLREGALFPHLVRQHPGTRDLRCKAPVRLASHEGRATFLPNSHPLPAVEITAPPPGSALSASTLPIRPTVQTEVAGIVCGTRFPRQPEGKDRIARRATEERLLLPLLCQTGRPKPRCYR